MFVVPHVTITSMVICLTSLLLPIRFLMKDPCVIFYGLIQMTVAGGEYHLEVPVTHLGKT